MRALPALHVVLSLLIAGAVAGVSGEVNEEEAVRTKTREELLQILEDLEIHVDSESDVDNLREIALREKAVGRWERLKHHDWRRRAQEEHIHGEQEVKHKPPGMDHGEWQKLMAQMKGDFSHEEDPEKRRLLEKLKAKGVSFGGASSLDVEQLKNLEAAMDGMGPGKFKMPGEFRTPGGVKQEL